VKDLDQTTETYKRLGFDRPIEGKLPNGLRNVNYYFSDATYLETLVYWDRAKAAWLANFTDEHSGALFLVLSAMSAEGTTAYLAGRGVKVGAPVSGTIQTSDEDAMPEEKWKTFFLPNGLLPGDPLYFIAYNRGPREDYLHKLDDPAKRRKIRHTNTALGLRAVWCAVPDLEAARKGYDAIGLVRRRVFDDAELGAEGQVYEAGRGELWILGPRAADGKLAAFLRDRGGPGIVGVTLAAGDVERAAKVIGERTGQPLTTRAGQLGTSVRVPPELTAGVWIEFAQTDR
jgi:hypothetical protein